MGIIYPKRPLVLLRGQTNATTVFTSGAITVPFSGTTPNGGTYAAGTYTFAHSGLVLVNATVYLTTTVNSSNCIISSGGSQAWAGYVSMASVNGDWSPIATLNYTTVYSAGDQVSIAVSNSVGAMRLLGSTTGAISTISIILLE